MIFTAADPPVTLNQRIALIIRRLAEVVGVRAHFERTLLPLMILLSLRLSSLQRRFNALTARIAEGRPAPRRGKSRAGRPRPRPLAPKPVLRLPSKFGWVTNLLGADAVYFRNQLEEMLHKDPELAALIAAEPAAGRILRPLCRLLAIPLIPALRLPPRPAPKPRPSRATRPTLTPELRAKTPAYVLKAARAARKFEKSKKS